MNLQTASVCEKRPAPGVGGLEPAQPRAAVPHGSVLAWGQGRVNWGDARAKSPEVALEA